MLSDRQRLILNAIIDNYIRSAEPVGSRTISKREDVGFSSATIRNEMSDLEELGYLEQPHTSAGRVPSTKGYRFYVDNLITPMSLNTDEVGNLKQVFADRIIHFEQVIEHTASILAQMTNYTAIAFGPEIFEHRLRSIQIIPLNERQAVAIIVTHTGRVENKPIDLPPGIHPGEIEKLTNILNTKLMDTPLSQLRHRLYEEVAAEMKQHVEQYQNMLQAIEGTMPAESSEKMFLRGTTKILDQPEFQDVDKVKDILQLFESNQQVHNLFHTGNSHGLQIRIGQENDVDAVKNCSIVTTSYYYNGKPVGTIGILGPTRMEYGKVISLLDYLAQGLSKILTNEFEK
ncbi:heat-inducible transcriptional repressor HrcA [Brevibacillus dissolubilis]|uniref:heat-inducible transcriptional repressor HrcA n=1 Tax=Brevibacillus dissolubilis TaxID=1844116 RepID=UPI00111622CB|nr:heat-inducible transcriptional repressor HrcA [Brevibacillus dissolubilis]